VIDVSAVGVEQRVHQKLRWAGQRLASSTVRKGRDEVHAAQCQAAGLNRARHVGDFADTKKRELAHGTTSSSHENAARLRYSLDRSERAGPGKWQLRLWRRSADASDGAERRLGVGTLEMSSALLHRLGWSRS
jgi:hypothetical protein